LQLIRVIRPRRDQVAPYVVAAHCIGSFLSRLSASRRTVDGMNNNFPNGGNGRGFMPPMRFDHGGHGGGSLGWVIFALELLLLAGIVILLVRAFTAPRFAGPPAGPPPQGKRRFGRPDPLTHARMRYANGEIGRDEYLQITRDLGGTPAPAAAAEEAPTEERPPPD
jgi:hypothetical protein